MGAHGEAWPPVTLVSGPPGSGKTHRIRAASDPARRVWLTLRDHHDGTELAARLVRHLRIRLPSLSSTIAATVAPSCGPTSDVDPHVRAEQLGALIAAAVGDVLDRELLLVFDELDRIADDSAAMRLVESLVRSSPEPLRIALATRSDLGFSVERLRAQGRLREIDDRELALSPVAAAALLADRFPSLTARRDEIVDLADGHAGALLAIGDLLDGSGAPAVEAIEAVHSAPDRMRAALRLAYQRLGALERRLADDLAVLETVTPIELARLQPDASLGTLQRLVAAQLVETHPDADTRFRLTRTAAEIVRPDPASAARRAADAVRLATGRGDPGAAIEIALAHGDRALLDETIAALGPAAIDAGHGRLVLDAIATLPEHTLHHGLAGRAAHALGDADRAIAEYRAAAASGPRAADAWRHGLLEYFRGNTGEAREIAAAALAAPHPGDAPADVAMLVGYAGAAAWLMGDLEAARADAERSLTLATAARDDAALAVAYTLAALVAASDGDRVSNDWHYVRALQHAERAGDLLQVARIRSNRGSRLMEEGEYDAALAELDDAVRHADLAGYGTMLALALSNRGEVLTKLGRLDDARTDLTAAVDLLQRLGSRMVAYPLVALGRLFVVRGDLEQARGSCERALALSEPVNDRQIVTAARVQLARALADRDPDAAWREAQLAAAAPESLDAAEAWTVVGLLAVQRGDAAGAGEAAARASELARQRRDRFALASALEVAALADLDVGGRRRRLEEAHTLFDELGCPLEAGRIEIALAHGRSDASAPGRIAAVAELARRKGARPLLALAEEAMRSNDQRNETLIVDVLGSFDVAIHGEVLPQNAWQSKKARDLFKMLVLLRGRPLPREQASERLWPDEPPEKVANKLSVALATVRAVLDPGKEFPADHYVQADSEAVRIQPASLTTDVDRFLTVADDALRQHRLAPGPRTAAMLAAAEAAYTGDVFEADPYVDWYVPAREEARAVYLTVTRALAAWRLTEHALDDAVWLLLRVLEREPYDEPAHLDLVATLTRLGRHGDARRRYQHYVERMRELELEPSPFPGFRAG